VLEVPNPLPDGAEADVVDHRGRFLGRGLLSAHSQILCRIYSREQRPLDCDFFRVRLLAAAQRRRDAGLPNDQTDSFRLVFAEGDRLSGLMVDRYGDYLVLQTPSSAMDQRKDMLVELLEELFQPAGICERNDMALRKQERLSSLRQWIRGQPSGPLRIRENGIVYEMDPLEAMKTGHFFDQRENRRWLVPICRDKKVLDAFCYTGGFGLTAALHGARSVLSLDSSEPTLALARANAQLNGVAERIDDRCGDAFDLLRELESENAMFDVVVLDPPAFAKRKANIENAARGYKQINLRALRMLPPGGMLLTCSCSSPINRDFFRDIVHEAAGDARRVVRIVAEGGAGPDHPALLNVPETDYLKSLLLEVVEVY
jgi:23S rRNA (cytosine1962-C5)-methyltransferase